MAPWEAWRGETVRAYLAAGSKVAVSPHGSAIAIRENDGDKWYPRFWRFDLTSDESGWKWCRMPYEVLCNGKSVVAQNEWVEQFP